MARRWLSGRQPCWRDVLHIAVKYGNSCGRNCLTMVVGTGSSAHDFVVPLTMMSSDAYMHDFKEVANIFCILIVNCGAIVFCVHLAGRM